MLEYGIREEDGTALLGRSLNNSMSAASFIGSCAFIMYKIGMRCAKGRFVVEAERQLVQLII